MWGDGPSTALGKLYACPRKLTDKRIGRATMQAFTAGSTRYVNDGFSFDPVSPNLRNFLSDALC